MSFIHLLIKWIFIECWQCALCWLYSEDSDDQEEITVQYKAQTKSEWKGKTITNYVMKESNNGMK